MNKSAVCEASHSIPRTKNITSLLIKVTVDILLYEIYPLVQLRQLSVTSWQDVGIFLLALLASKEFEIPVTVLTTSFTMLETPVTVLVNPYKVLENPFKVCSRDGQVELKLVFLMNNKQPFRFCIRVKYNS